jgi:hypothetical protein
MQRRRVRGKQGYSHLSVVPTIELTAWPCDSCRRLLLLPQPARLPGVFPLPTVPSGPICNKIRHQILVLETSCERTVGPSLELSSAVHGCVWALRMRRRRGRLYSLELFSVYFLSVSRRDPTRWADDARSFDSSRGEKAHSIFRNRIQTES